MMSKYLNLINTQKKLTRELIQSQKYKEELNFILNNIRGARAYKLWQKLKKIRSFISSLYDFKRSKPLCLGNTFISIITYLDNVPEKKIEYFLKSIFFQSYPNIELIYKTSGRNIKSINKLLNHFKKQKKIDMQLINYKKTDLSNIINLAKGKYICFLKPKYTMDPNYIEKCIIKMELEKLDMCFAETNIKFKKKKIDPFKKSIINPEYAVVSKKYFLNIIKPPSMSKISEPLVKALNNIK